MHGTSASLGLRSTNGLPARCLRRHQPSRTT